MSDTFRRHTRACVDAAVHRVFTTHRDRAFFERLLRAVRARSTFMKCIRSNSVSNMESSILASLNFAEKNFNASATRIFLRLQCFGLIVSLQGLNDIV